MRRPPAPFVLLAGLLALYLAAPFAAGLLNAGTADWAGADRPALLRATLVSVASATAATALVAVGGVPLAFLLARRRSAGSALLGFLVQLPLALPPLASGILLLFLLGYGSPLGRLTGGRLTESFVGVVLAETFVAAPFLIIAARSAFAGLDTSLEEVVATLGHGPAAVFRRVSLPLATRAIVSGLLLTWLRAFGEFGATVMVAYHPYSLPVYTYVAFGERGLPAMLPVLAPTLAAAAVVLFLSLAVRSRRRPGAIVEDLIEGGVSTPVSLPTEAGPTLAVRVNQRFGDFQLDVAWRSDARRLAVLGPSGSGKTALLRTLAGLHRDSGSRVLFGDLDLGRLPPERRNIGYVPQHYALVPQLTVAQQIRLAADCDERAAAHWEERLGLRELAGRSCDALSLGQQQRVALARALSRATPRLLLLDEPFSALDAPLRSRLREEMLALQGEIGATTLLVTHDPAEALLLADHLLLLEGGRVLQAGPAAEVFSRPVSETAARLLGATVIGRGRATSADSIDLGAGVQLQVAGPPLVTGAAVGWAIRPHRIRFAPDGAYPARLDRCGKPVAGARRVDLKLGACTLAVPVDADALGEGACAVDMDPSAIQVWPEAQPRTAPEA